MKYQVGDKVEYCYRFKGHYHYAHGYIKAVRHGIFSTKYVINMAKSDFIHVCKESCVFGKIEKKERVNERIE